MVADGSPPARPTTQAGQAPRKRKPQPRQKHIPQRTCIACKQVRPKRELIRVVRTPEGHVELDPTSKKSGRGAYVCARRSCWDIALHKGKLERLANRAASESQVSVHAIGFTKQMDQYMAAADILISKPGGLTTAEAMARGLPTCIVNPIPGQEERNSDHLLEAGVAIKCNNPPTLAWKLEGLARDSVRMAQMRQRAMLFGRPRAGEEIVARLLGSVEGNPRR